MKAVSTFSPTTWDEKPYGEISPPMRMTKATVEFAFKGQFEGQGLTEYLMFYKEYDAKDPHKATAVYVGLTRFKGILNGKRGSFVTEDRGTFENGAASSVSAILKGSGTDDLKGIRGNCKSVATQNRMEFEMDFAF